MRNVAARLGAIVSTLVLGLGFAAVSAPAATAADDVTTWAVQPSSAEGPDGRDAFVYTLAPGETVTDYIGVSNLGTTPLNLRVYAMDAAMTADGAFTLPPADTPSTDVGTWVGFNGDGVFTVEPGTRIDVPFRLTVSPTASPGDHAGGIVASVVELAGGGDGEQQVAVDRRVGARVYVNVPGDQLPAVDVSNVSIAYSASPIFASGPATVSFDVTNDGNMRVGGPATIEITGPFGLSLDAVHEIEVPEILPGATVTLSAELEDVPPALLLFATVTLEPMMSGAAADVDGEHSATGMAWAVPWLLIVALVIVIAIIVLVWLRGRRLRQRLAAAEAAAAEATAASAARESVTEPSGTAAGPTEVALERDLPESDEPARSS
ncbi:hypothetical protein ACFC3F_09800 [Microbacterium sp. NPDC055910]|uniref:hypothetical protein n=1 Tax=Microbacterium sp. NPDC055910 TaxID=3345659 RepID=UPI0035DA8954